MRRKTEASPRLPRLPMLGSPGEVRLLPWALSGPNLGSEVGAVSGYWARGEAMGQLSLSRTRAQCEEVSAHKHPPQTPNVIATSVPALVALSAAAGELRTTLCPPTEHSKCAGFLADGAHGNHAAWGGLLWLGPGGAASVSSRGTGRGSLSGNIPAALSPARPYRDAASGPPAGLWCGSLRKGLHVAGPGAEKKEC